jgi:hypothetical protein
MASGGAPTPSAVRIFPLDHPAMADTLRKRLEKRREQALEEFLGPPITTSDDERRGKVLMLDEIIQMCLDIDRELTERNK